ncbi:MAG: hypothetical protein M3O36_02150, partial [Myxococcota bacterium]|nr:hypothetical protein [Myxococcota bacterium]
MRFAAFEWPPRWSRWIAGGCAAAAGACAFPDVSFSSALDGGTEQAPTLHAGSGSSGSDLGSSGAGSAGSGAPLPLA